LLTRVETCGSPFRDFRTSSERAECYGPPPTFAARLTTGIAAASAPATKAATQSRLILEIMPVLLPSSRWLITD